MGLLSLFSYFSRKELTFEQQLEKLGKSISQLEESKRTRYQTQRKLVTALLLYSIIIEGVIGLWYWWHQKPINTFDKVIHISPLILFPTLMYLLRILVSKFYARRIRSDDARLTLLRNEMKKKIEERKKATDFDATQKLLSKYEQIATKQSNSPAPAKKPEESQPIPTPAGGQPTTAAANTLRQRPIPQPSQPSQPQNSQPQPQKPAIPPNRSWFDKLVDYMVGVNSQNGFALICSNCRAHNGLAPSSELEDIQFRCRFCGHFNGDLNPTLPLGRPRTASNAPQPQHPLPQTPQSPQPHTQQVPPTENQPAPAPAPAK